MEDVYPQAVYQTNTLTMKRSRALTAMNLALLAQRMAQSAKLVQKVSHLAARYASNAYQSKL